MAKKKPNRKSVLTQRKRLEAALNHFRKGGTIRGAAGAGKMALSTLQEAIKSSPEFAEKVEIAKCEGVARSELRILEGDRSWKARLQMLARQYPDEFASTRIHQHNGHIDHVHSGNVTIQQLLIELDSSRVEQLEQLARSRIESGNTSEFCLPCQPGEVDASQASNADR